jgi:aminoglycoside/choline kinase family phosphotransferase
MEKNIDEKNDKFSVVEYEKFKRVVDYMKNTNYAESKIIEGRKDFYNWFNALDSRRDTKFLEIFPELEEFYYGCKSLLSH